MVTWLSWTIIYKSWQIILFIIWFVFLRFGSHASFHFTGLFRAFISLKKKYISLFTSDNTEWKRKAHARNELGIGSAEDTCACSLSEWKKELDEMKFLLCANYFNTYSSGCNTSIKTSMHMPGKITQTCFLDSFSSEHPRIRKIASIMSCTSLYWQAEQKKSKRV